MHPDDQPVILPSTPPPGADQPPPPAPADPPRGRRSLAWIVAGIVGVIAGAGIATAGWMLDRGELSVLHVARSAPLEDAVDCAPDSPDLQIGDDGHTLQLQTKSADELAFESEFPPPSTGGGIWLDELECVLNRLDAPDAVSARIEQTRALDGTQEATWGEFVATWTYHPDDGVSMVIEQR